MSFYSREIIRQVREREECGTVAAMPPSAALDQIPADAPMDDATITVWNGERWVEWRRWRATTPVAREEAPEAGPAFPRDVTGVAGVCGDLRVWLVKGHDRWLMFVGSRNAGGRRKDFATPFLAHAIRTAEAWYGAPANGWRAEKGRDEKGIHEAAGVSPQGADLAEYARR